MKVVTLLIILLNYISCSKPSKNEGSTAIKQIIQLQSLPAQTSSYAQKNCKTTEAAIKFENKTLTVKSVSFYSNLATCDNDLKGTAGIYNSSKTPGNSSTSLFCISGNFYYYGYSNGSSGTCSKVSIQLISGIDYRLIATAGDSTLEKL